MFIVGHKDGAVEQKSNIHLTNVKGYQAYTIIGGEFAVAKDSDNVAFKTLLGSCVAIMFYDILFYEISFILASILGLLAILPQFF